MILFSWRGRVISVLISRLRMGRGWCCLGFQPAGRSKVEKSFASLRHRAMNDIERSMIWNPYVHGDLDETLEFTKWCLYVLGSLQFELYILTSRGAGLHILRPQRVHRLDLLSENAVDFLVYHNCHLICAQLAFSHERF